MPKENLRCVLCEILYVCDKLSECVTRHFSRIESVTHSDNSSQTYKISQSTQQHIHVHVGIYPLFISLFEHINLFHLLEFIDYRIARLSSEIVTCTFFFFRTTFLQTAVYIPTILSALWIVLAILFWTSQSAQSVRFTYVYICQLTILHWCIVMNI